MVDEWWMVVMMGGLFFVWVCLCAGGVCICILQGVDGADHNDSCCAYDVHPHATTGHHCVNWHTHPKTTTQAVQSRHH